MNVEQARAAIEQIENPNAPAPAAATPKPNTGPAVCTQPECREQASYAYRWAWGETGMCCATHRNALEQLSRNLKREIHFDRLETAPVAPMSRDERTRLKAAMLVAEEERDEAKQRAADLYKANAQLAQQLQALTVRQRESEAQLRDLSVQRDEAERQRDEAQAKWGDVSDELQRLKLIADNAPDLAEVEGMRRELSDARTKAAELERQAQAHAQQLQQRDRRIAEQNAELTALKKQG